MKYKSIKKGIQNTMAKIDEIKQILGENREEMQVRLRKMFYAQQPRLEDKVEHQVLLEQVINQILDVKYDLRPMLEMLKTKNVADYRRTYSLTLKVEDSIGRTLGRLGLTLSPQRYIPTAELKVFDPRAVKALKEKSESLVDQIKDMPEQPVEIPTPFPAKKEKKKNGS